MRPFPIVPALLVATWMVAPTSARAQAEHRRLLADTPECRDCQIGLELVAELRGPSVQGEPLAIARLADGRFLVSYYPGGDVVWEYSADGATSRVFAATGKGPGEVSYVTTITRIARDTVVLFEAGNGRASVFAMSDQGLTRTFRVPGRVLDATPVRERGFVVNAEISSAERFGLPLHVLESEGAVGMSFGGMNDGVMRPDMPHLAKRRVTSDGIDRVWSVMPTDYEITQWTAAGQHVEAFVRDVDWFRPYFVDRAVDPARDFQPWIADLQWLAGNQVAVVVHLGATDWRRHLGPPYTIPRSKKVVYPSWNLAKVHETLIEVIDISTGAISATGRFPGYAVGFVGPAHIAFYAEDAVGEPTVQVHRISVRQR